MSGISGVACGLRKRLHLQLEDHALPYDSVKTFAAALSPEQIALERRFREIIDDKERRGRHRYVFSRIEGFIKSFGRK